MIGFNKLVLNRATVMEALEEHYNSRALVRGEIEVTNFTIENRDNFVVTFKPKEKENDDES
jgi:hypothetical protein